MVEKIFFANIKFGCSDSKIIFDKKHNKQYDDLEFK